MMGGRARVVTGANMGYHICLTDKNFLLEINQYCRFLKILLLCPRDDSQGALRFAPVCLSVRPFVTLYSIEFV